MIETNREIIQECSELSCLEEVARNQSFEKTILGLLRFSEHRKVKSASDNHSANSSSSGAELLPLIKSTEHVDRVFENDKQTRKTLFLKGNRKGALHEFYLKDGYDKLVRDGISMGFFEKKGKGVTVRQSSAICELFAKYE